MPLLGLAKANAELVLDLQCRRPVKTATLDVDATVIHCDKRAAKRSYDGNRGYQPVLALWAEQDVIVADEFRDGNVPAGSGNRRVVEKALAALPGGIDKIYLRGDSALYEHDLMRWLDEQAIGYAISADMSPQLAECIAALPEGHWKPDKPEIDAIREWAEVNYLPSDGIWKKDAVSPRRYLAIRIRPRQGELLRDGNRVRHFCIVTNRSDPQAGSGLELIRWHRQKAGTIEHAHDVLMNELAGAALPSQKFGANAAWLRFNVTLYNLLSAFKRIPPDPSGYASCCSTPSARSSAMPARPSCAAPRRSPESSPERREPASPSNARLSRGLRGDIQWRLIVYADHEPK